MRHSMPNHSFPDLVVCPEARRATSRIGGNEENRNARLLLRITEIDFMVAFKFPSFQVVKYSLIKKHVFSRRILVFLCNALFLMSILYTHNSITIRTLKSGISAQFIVCGYKR
jgi:hypothetical protein